jgi:hypothetical protein
MGIHSYEIFIPDGDIPINYSIVLLTQTGDYESHNLSSEAAFISSWLSKISW